MLPCLALNSSTIDHFRKNVYRPRLCLLLLLILLSPNNVSQLTNPSNTHVSASQPASQGWSVSIIDGLVVAAPPSPPAFGSLTPSVTSSDSSEPQSYRSHAGSFKSPPNLPDPAAPSPAPKPRLESAKPDLQAQPAPGSLFRFPKLSWGLLIDSHVLPVLLPIHLLWLIRLLGMAVEDGIVKTTLLGAKSRFYAVTLPTIYLITLASLTILVSQSRVIDALKVSCETWRTQLGLLNDNQRSNGERVSHGGSASESLLPLKTIVMLEAAATTAALLSAYLKIEGSPLSRTISNKVKLPSPSHSPSLLELLPLPSTLKAAWFESRSQASLSPYTATRRPMMPSLVDHVTQRQPPAQITSPSVQQHTATTTAIESFDRSAAVYTNPDEEVPQQMYRRIGAPEAEVLRSTSVARPIAPLRLPDPISPSTPAPSPPSSASNSYDRSYSVSRRRRAPRMRGQSVLVSTRWLSETLVALLDKIIGSLLYAIITLRLPTLQPTSLPPVLSLLSLRSELASLTNVWTKARSSVECLEFVRRRWGVQLEHGKDPYRSVQRPRAAAACGDYAWKSYEDVYCAICFERTRPAAQSRGSSMDVVAKDTRSKVEATDEPAPKYEFCRLDCGHELHDVCLVSWLTAQAFCPTCHVVLSFSPRSVPSQHP